jgi:hypothetical protein
VLGREHDDRRRDGISGRTAALLIFLTHPTDASFCCSEKNRAINRHNHTDGVNQVVDGGGDSFERDVEQGKCPI